MTTPLAILHQARFTTPSQVVVGDDRVPITVNLTNGAASAIFGGVVTDNYGNLILWSATNPTSFTHGFITATADIYVQFKNNKATPEYLIVFVPAGVPFYFGPTCGGGTTSHATGAALVVGTDYGTTTEIKAIRNAATGAGSATVRMALFN